MLLLELQCNTDPSVILQNIADHISGKNTRMADCHSTTGNAIMSGKASDNDRIVVLGRGTVGTHTIIVDQNGKIIEDSYGNRIKDYDPRTLEISYYATKDQNPKAVWNLTPLKIVPVKQLKASLF